MNQQLSLPEQASDEMEALVAANTIHTIAFTGHRPRDLNGETYAQFRDALDALGVGKRKDLYFVVGGALGVDTWAAWYAIHNDIPYHLILPFEPAVMTQRWTEYAKETLTTHINLADAYTVMSGGDQYRIENYQRRNEAMVNIADVVFAVWNGRLLGGTANCIRYALRKERPTYNLYPLNGRMRKVKEIG
jgi:uncharacterized phage-like protein YoqJ